MSRTPRPSAVLIASAAMLAIVGMGIAAVLLMPPATQRTDTGKSTGLVSTSAIGGPFSLIDQDGKPVTEHSYDGRYRLMFFGYTHCPDFCPTELYKLSQVMAQLPKQQVDRLAPIFVTIDPARDTPAVMKDYLAALDPRFIGLSGSEQQIRDVAKTFRVYFHKADSDDPEFYSMDHSTFTYVMGPDNRFIDIISYEMDIPAMVKKISGIMAQDN